MTRKPDPILNPEPPDEVREAVAAALAAEPAPQPWVEAALREATERDPRD